MPKPLLYWILPAALCCAALLHGCESSPTPSETDARAAARDEAVKLTDAPTPPGIPPQALATIDPAQRERAQITLDEIVASITPPPHLGGNKSQEQSVTKDPIEPPLAAQKFYAAGRQALLDGDNFAAVQAFDKALRLSPNEASILRGLGQAWARAGNRVSAANHYRQAVAADPADLDSVFMLGRFAIDDRRWESAVLNFDTARRLADQDAQTASIDSDTQRLSRFYLANALNQAGYARAALAMYQDYLADADRRSSGNSRYARELSIIDAQQGETLSLIGDLHHRLGEPELALNVYELAARVGVLNPDTLRRRLLYTRLRLGQPRAAEALVTQAVAESGGDTRVLELIKYAVAQGVPADQLSGRLTQLYQDQGEPAALAVALADVLPADDAASLLSQHLQSHPDDDAVFGKLLSVSIDEPLDANDRRTLIDRTVAAMIARPNFADRYAQQLLDNLEAPVALLVGYPEYRKPAAAESAPPSASRLAMSAFLHGQILTDIDKPDAAAEAYRFVLEHSPDFTSARIALAAYHVDQDEYETAEALLLPLGDNAPIRATELRVKALTQAERYDEALALINQSLQRTTPGSRLMLDKAALLIELDRISEAERTLLDALNARPTDESIYAALLQLYDAQSNLRQNQVRLIRRMIETIPNARITRLIRVEYLLANRNYDDALQLLNLLGQTGGDEQRIIRMQLEAYVGLKQPDAIESLVEQHLAASGNAPDNELMDQAIRNLFRVGETQRALRLEERRWDVQLPSLQRSQSLNEVYFTQELYEKAAAAAQDAISLSVSEEDRLTSHWLHIRSLFKLEKFDEAEQSLAAATKDTPEDGGSLSFLTAMLYDQLGDAAASRRVMEAGLEKYPLHPSMNNTLGYGLATEGVRLQDARQMIERALATQPDEAAYLDSLGWVYYKLGEFEQALGWLEKSRAALPDANPVILDHIGDTLYRLGREAEAVRAWNQANMKLLTPNYVKEDPEEEGLEDRLSNKIKAVAEQQPAPVASVGQGIELPAPEPEAAPKVAPENALEAPAVEALEAPNPAAAAPSAPTPAELAEAEATTPKPAPADPSPEQP